jgi:glycosyltransferase involved in cell wall biosynthesis
MDLGVIKAFNHNSKLHCVFLKNNTFPHGPGGARNKGLSCSANNNVLFLDADDLFAHSKVLENLYQDTL